MIKAKLFRTFQDSRATLGMIRIVGVQHDPFFTLENPDRITLHDCLIPAGKYQCEPFSGTKYKDVYILKNVPGRSSILIHWGNTEADTLGCILVGDESGMLDGQPAIKQSKRGFDRLRSIIGSKNFELDIVSLV